MMSIQLRKKKKNRSDITPDPRMELVVSQSILEMPCPCVLCFLVTHGSGDKLQTAVSRPIAHVKMQRDTKVLYACIS